MMKIVTGDCYYFLLIFDMKILIKNRYLRIPTLIRHMKKMNFLEFIEKRGSFKVMFKNNLNSISEQVNEQVSEQVLNNVERYKIMVLNFCIEPKSAKEIWEFLNLNSRNYVSDKIIKTLLIEGKLDYTNKKVLMQVIKNIL